MPSSTPSPSLLRFQNPAIETPLDPEHLKCVLHRGISNITVRSTDGVFLYLHRKNLQAITKVFNTSEFLANSESGEDVVYAFAAERADFDVRGDLVGVGPGCGC